MTFLTKILNTALSNSSVGKQLTVLAASELALLVVAELVTAQAVAVEFELAVFVPEFVFAVISLSVLTFVLEVSPVLTIALAAFAVLTLVLEAFAVLTFVLAAVLTLS